MKILLVDDSVLQFGIEGNTLRYCFIQNPRVFFTKNDYLNYLYPPEDLLAFSEEELTELETTIEDEDYEQFLNEQDLNLQAHILRYDLDHKGYDPLVHALSHIHVGLNENLRIPCSKILTPLNFTFFAIKHTYYKIWKSAIKNELLQKQLNKSKASCHNVPKTHWVDIEKYELYLT